MKRFRVAYPIVTDIQTLGGVWLRRIIHEGGTREHFIDGVPCSLDDWEKAQWSGTGREVSP